MSTVLLRIESDLLEGIVAGRPNRFILDVELDGSLERVYLGDPGALSFLTEGARVLCRRVNDSDRKTAYDAIAVELDGLFVSLRPALANVLFERAVVRNLLASFSGCSILSREPTYPDHGRADFELLHDQTGENHFVEVKSCTDVTGRTAKFPDRQTARGRRHLRSLISLATEGRPTHLVFVVQRPDVERVKPNRSVDPEFADLLKEAASVGVGVHAFTVSLDPPRYNLVDSSIPVAVE